MAASYISVPRDLTKVKSKVMFNLTKRQLICFSVAALIGVPSFFLISAVRYKENNPWTGVWSGDYMVEETYNPNSKYHKNLVIAESLSVIENVLLFSISNYFRSCFLQRSVYQEIQRDGRVYQVSA